ncbi:MAG: hypothetical protein MJ168_08450 [Clostridia bacterium]|nr:hypothetical protein [Clostridia bacterium]
MKNRTAIRILNVNENELYSPVDDVRTNVKNISYILPYSKQIRGQHLDGLLYERAKDKKYRTELSKIINKIPELISRSIKARSLWAFQ